MRKHTLFSRPRRYRIGRIVVGILRIVIRLLLKLDVRGAERVPTSGPVVLVGNHINFLDPVLAYTIPRRYVKGMTAIETYRKPFFRFLAWSVDAIPVERGTPDLSDRRAKGRLGALRSTRGNAQRTRSAPARSRRHHACVAPHGH